jgi:hypothetical protein
MVALTLASIIAVAMGCSKLPAETDIELVKKCYKQTVNATTITQSVTVKNGKNLVSSKVIVYNIALDKSVTGTQTVTTLNEDMLADDPYVVENSNIAFSADEAAAALPTSITLDANEFVGGNYTYTEGTEYNTFSFQLKNESIQTFFGLTSEEAEGISDAKVTILMKDQKVTEYKAIYATDKGNSVEIKITFAYSE